MNAPARIPIEADSIRAFMPQVSDEEYALRSRIRAAMTCACAGISTAGSETERCLWAILRDHASAWWLAPAPLEVLARAHDLCTAIWRSTQRAIALEHGIDLEAASDGGG